MYISTDKTIFFAVTSDYRNDGGLGTIPAGTTETQVSFAIIDDNIEEVNVESFGVVLSVIGQPTGVSLGQNQGTVTITDDDSEFVHYKEPGNTHTMSGFTFVDMVSRMSMYCPEKFTFLVSLLVTE